MASESLQIVFGLLGIIYVLYVFLLFYRGCQIFTEKNYLKIAISFYISLFFSLLTRIIVFILYFLKVIYQQNEENNISTMDKFIDLLLTIPDMVNICMFLIILWHYFTYFIISHINLSVDLGDLFTNTAPKLTKIINYIIYAVLPFLIVIFALCCFLFIFLNFSEKTFILISDLFNLVIPILTAVGNFIFNIKYSGRPFKNQESKTVSFRIALAAIFWGLGRVGVAIVQIIVFKTISDNYPPESSSGSLIKELIDSLKTKQNSIISSLYFTLTELVPYYFVLDSSLIKSFFDIGKKNEPLLKENEQENIIDPMQVAQIEWIDNDSLNKKVIKINQRHSVTNYFIPIKEIQIQEEIFIKENGLGEIHKGIYNSNEIICRVIQFDRISRYEIEDISKDFEQVVNMSNPNLVSLLGISFEESKIVLVYPYFKNGSLYDYLHEQNKSLSTVQKLNIAVGIIKGLQYLHECKIFHYHLSSRNILLNENLNPYIADYGLPTLESNASIFLNYSNKNSYSSPEILNDQKKMCHKIDNYEYNDKNDIYSFGILLWEIYTETIPFNIELSEVKNYVVEQKMRPEIPSGLDKEIAQMIRECWDSEPSKRPSLDQILSVLLKKL